MLIKINNTSFKLNKLWFSSVTNKLYTNLTIIPEDMELIKQFIDQSETINIEIANKNYGDYTKEDVNFGETQITFKIERGQKV